MDRNDNRKLIGKIEIKGVLKCLTGLHIGASKEGMEIGALDSPVVRDPMTLEPYIPGSSLKGKLRALLEKAHPDLLPNRDGGSGTSRHECNDWDEGACENKNYDNQSVKYPGALNCPVCRLFGSSGSGGENMRSFPARVKIRDLKLKNVDELRKIDTGLLYTEWKFENTIDRVTSAANPRNLERVPKGAEFDFSIIYDVEDPATLSDDMSNLKLAMELLRDDSLGGHGSREYGQVLLSLSHVERRSIAYYRGDKKETKRISMLDEEIDALISFFKNNKPS